MGATVLNLFEGSDDHSIQRQLGFLAEISQSFASSLDIDEALQNALSQFLKYLNAEGAAIFLLEEDGRELVCRGCVGPVDVTGLRLTPNQGIVGRAVSQHECQMVRDVSQDPDFYHQADQQSDFQTRSILCAPLMVRGECLGALELLNKQTGDGLFADSDRHLTAALASAAALAIHNSRMAQSLIEQQRLQKELELAREIQVGLLPPAAGDTFPVQAVNLPAQAVSGDFYDYFQLADGRIYFNLADVSGKGMNAALLMARASSLLHYLAKTETDPGRILGLANEALCETASHGMFITIVSGFFNPHNGSVSFANAGHLPPLFQDADGHFHEYAAAVPPLGVLADSEFPTQTLQLAGGCLYLYTDGVTESRDLLGAQLEVRGFKDIIRAHADKSLPQRLMNLINDIMRDQSPHDDTTLMLIGCPPR
ncbi:sigma-B regulation protein RsbU (phosphoserine phosphatase) [Methylohalomonas lacus]|uniref:Sigma-B regulation protein RsbU (Phosphoserine phosphatase) n=1 Tax=Methylohalomonas lacus TaxID=398773 RepID=A0AAE3HKR8_9GAMM|nr:GAF domain-containing SpoIIE family protein phosphatase [Methylohalomonas lacus]MCS3903033.1 sigma-B regulation protein RsbU (phosphoserine phosphatase) [Methylohalomonas lacus]